MIIVTTENVPGKKVAEYCGFCNGSTVHTKHVGRDIAASFKTIVGGEIKGYTEMMMEARKVAIDRMIKDATSMGADAIVSMRLATSNVMPGASEIIAYGTAVKTSN